MPSLDPAPNEPPEDEVIRRMLNTPPKPEPKRGLIHMTQLPTPLNAEELRELIHGRLSMIETILCAMLKGNPDMSLVRSIANLIHELQHTHASEDKEIPKAILSAAAMGRQTTLDAVFPDWSAIEEDAGYGPQKP